MCIRDSYKSFDEFFTRPLRAGARPLADADLLCPVDGAISQFGPIERDQIFQAKGHRYSTTALLGGDRALATRFENGAFATLYLSPRDYHRIHMPCDGRLMRMIYIPGALFSVNPTTARGVPGLFARNERVVCVFDSAFGPFVLDVYKRQALAKHPALKAIITTSDEGAFGVGDVLIELGLQLSLIHI